MKALAAAILTLAADDCQRSNSTLDSALVLAFCRVCPDDHAGTRRAVAAYHAAQAAARHLVDVPMRASVRAAALRRAAAAI